MANENVQIVSLLKNLVAHHRKFTYFQKTLVTSICILLWLCVSRSVWSLMLTITYAVSVYISVVLANFLTQSNHFVPSDVLFQLMDDVSEFFKSVFQPQPLPTKTISDNVGASSTSFVSESGKTIDFDQERTDVLTIKDDNAKFLLEIDNIIKLIQRDFISSWLQLFTKEDLIYQESEDILHHIFQNLKERCHKSKANYIHIMHVIILKYKEHLHVLKQAELDYKAEAKIRKRPSLPTNAKPKYTSVEECYSSKVDIHPASVSKSAEHAYLRSVVEILLLHLLKDEMHYSKAILCVLKEIIMVNVLENILNLLSLPEFLHEKIIFITSDEDLVVIASHVSDAKSLQEESLNDDNGNDSVHMTCTPPFLSDQKGPQSNAKDYEDNVNIKSLSTIFNSGVGEESCADTTEDCETNGSSRVQWLKDLDEHVVSTKMCAECNRLCSKDKDKISPRPHTCYLGTTPFFFDPTVREPDRMSINSVESYKSVYSQHSDEEEVYGDKFKKKGSVDQRMALCNDTDDRKNGEKNDLLIVKPEGAVLSEQSSDCESINSGIEQRDVSPSSDAKSKPVFTFNTLGFALPNPLNSFPFSRKKSMQSIRKDLTPSPTPDEENGQAIYVKIQRSKSSSEIESLSESLSSNGSPLLFQNIKIKDTEKATEAGSIGIGQSEYTLYNLEVSSVQFTYNFFFLKFMLKNSCQSSFFNHPNSINRFLLTYLSLKAFMKHVHTYENFNNTNYSQYHCKST